MHSAKAEFNQYIAMRSLVDLCEAAEKKQGEWVGMRWWEQAGIDLTGERDKAAVEDEGGLEE